MYRTPGAHLEGSWCPIALGTGACDSQRAGLQDTHDNVPSTVGSKTVDLLECPTSEMIADALTKPLTYDEFRKYRDVMVYIHHD